MPDELDDMIERMGKVLVFDEMVEEEGSHQLARDIQTLARRLKKLEGKQQRLREDHRLHCKNVLLHMP